MPQLVWMADAEGTVVYYNSRAVRTRETYQCEHRIQMATGEYRWHLSRGVPLIEAGQVIQWFGTATDIHSVKTAEQELQASARNKDEFLAVLAHELRNPLAPIRNALELLRTQPADEGTRRLHAMLDRQVMHMVRLVDDLLEISRISRGELRLERVRVAMCDVLDAAIEAAMPAFAQGRIRFERGDVPESLHLVADPIRLAQAFGNLLNNAAKFTPADGLVRVSVHAADGMIEVAIADTGIGLDDAALESIFGLFVQGEPGANEVRSGLGVGLALVRRVVELHGGTVEARSAGRGCGSIFVVRLPQGY